MVNPHLIGTALRKSATKPLYFELITGRSSFDSRSSRRTIATVSSGWCSASSACGWNSGIM
jgi:hypothetical protein